MEGSKTIFMKIKCLQCNTTFRTNWIHMMLEPVCHGCNRQKDKECIEVYRKGNPSVLGKMDYDCNSRVLLFDIDDEDAEYELHQQLFPEQFELAKLDEAYVVNGEAI